MSLDENVFIRNLTSSQIKLLAAPAGSIPYFDNEIMTQLNLGPAGSVLTSAGAGNPPTFSTVPTPVIPDPLSLGELKTDTLSTNLLAEITSSPLKTTTVKTDNLNTNLAAEITTSPLKTTTVKTDNLNTNLAAEITTSPLKTTTVKTDTLNTNLAAEITTSPLKTTVIKTDTLNTNLAAEITTSPLKTTTIKTDTLNTNLAAEITTSPLKTTTIKTDTLNTNLAAEITTSPLKTTVIKTDTLSANLNPSIQISSVIKITNTDSNTSFGYEALNSNIGTNNTSVGHQSLKFNTTGSGNTALGYRALLNNNPTETVAIGQNHSCNGNYCSLIGNQIRQVTGSYNQIIGSNIGQDLLGSVSGTGNVALGNNIARFQNSISGDRNILIGNNIANNSLPNGNINLSGTDNIFIGSSITDQTGGNTPSHCIFIGTDTGFPIGIGSPDDVVCIGRGARGIVSGTVQFFNTATSFPFGSVRFGSQQVAAGSWIGGGVSTATIDNSGNIIRTVSDERLKENITSVNSFVSPTEKTGETNGTNEIIENFKKLEVKKFTYKDQKKFGKNTELGLIAQQVKDLFPALVGCSGEPVPDGLVERNENNEIIKQECYLSLNYQGFIPVMITVLQNIIGRLEALEN